MYVEYDTLWIGCKVSFLFAAAALVPSSVAIRLPLFSAIHLLPHFPPRSIIFFCWAFRWEQPPEKALPSLGGQTLGCGARYIHESNAETQTQAE